VNVLVCDTGPLVAVLNKDDKDHDRCVALFDEFDGPLVVPSLIVTEVCYLAQTRIGGDEDAANVSSRRNILFGVWSWRGMDGRVLRRGRSLV